MADIRVRGGRGLYTVKISTQYHLNPQTSLTNYSTMIIKNVSLPKKLWNIHISVSTSNRGLAFWAKMVVYPHKSLLVIVKQTCQNNVLMTYDKEKTGIGISCTSHQVLILQKPESNDFTVLQLFFILLHCMITMF